MPLYLLLQHPWFTAAQEKNLKIREDARKSRNKVKSSSPNMPST
jgi:hypothetical protein